MRRQRRKRQRVIRPEPEVSGLKFSAQLAVRVPGELALRLRKFCRESGQSFNGIVAAAIKQYLTRKTRKTS